VTFSPEWDNAFRANTHISVWPWSDLVSYVHRYASPAAGFRCVLELGCGVGANISLFRKLNVDYCAIEGSETAVARLHDAYPDLADKIVVGDFTQAIPFDGPFDLVVDRAALTHNTTAAIDRAFRMIFNLVRSGGKFIGIDWFSTLHHDFHEGVSIDTHTRMSVSAGPFAGVGAVHFSDQKHIMDLTTTAGFRMERMEHKQSDVIIPNEGHRLATWNFVAVKP
jgi:SAM-dependent methyltransferase